MIRVETVVFGTSHFAVKDRQFRGRFADIGSSWQRTNGTMIVSCVGWYDIGYELNCLAVCSQSAKQGSPPRVLMRSSGSMPFFLARERNVFSPSWASCNWL